MILKQLYDYGICKLIDNDDTDNRFNNWFYQRNPKNDITGRPIWRYDDTEIGGLSQSVVRYNQNNGWNVELTFNGINTM